MKLYGNISNFDMSNTSLVLNLMFIDEEEIEKINKLISNGGSYAIEIKEKSINVDQKANWEQQKKWFVDMYLIIKSELIKEKLFDTLSHEEISSMVHGLHQELKYQYFPVSYIKVGKLEIPTIPKLRDIAHTEFSKIISKLEMDYSESPYEVDFTNVE